MTVAELDFLRRCLEVNRENKWKTVRVWWEMEITSSITKTFESMSMVHGTDIWDSEGEMAKIHVI